jgi:hypothetical protein
MCGDDLLCMTTSSCARHMVERRPTESCFSRGQRIWAAAKWCPAVAARCLCATEGLGRVDGKDGSGE